MSEHRDIPVQYNGLTTDSKGWIDDTGEIHIVLKPRYAEELKELVDSGKAEKFILAVHIPSPPLDEEPCGEWNSNVCVAEGCFGNECVRES
jgi:hypothetical protein